MTNRWAQLSCGLLMVFLPMHASLSAQPPALINYQGRLVEGTNLVTGTVAMRLRLFDAAEFGSLLYEDASMVTVVDGLYATAIGDDTTFGNLEAALGHDAVWLETMIDDVPLAPRERILSVAYSLKTASVADGAVTTASLADGAVTADKIADGSITANELAKPPRSGSVSSTSLDIHFGQADFSVLFDPPFAATPVVTLGLQPGYPPSLGDQVSLYIKSRATGGFTGRFSAPVAVQKLSEYGVYSSMALVNGTPAICAAGTPASVQYLRSSDSTGQNWSYPIKLDLNSGGAMYTRMAVVNGNPGIAYVSSSSVVKFIRATDANGTAWGSPTIVTSSAESSFSFICLAVVNGNPAIAYREYPAWDLKYVRATDADGTSWGVPVDVDTVGSVGRYCSMAVVNGHPAISYEDLSNTHLKYVRATDANGAGWGTPVVADPAGGFQTSLAVVNGRPAIGYSKSSGGTQFVRADDADGATWGDPVVVGSYGADISLQVVAGRPAMSFIAGRLQYARAADADGTAWFSPALLDTEASAAGNTSLLVLPTGLPAVSYYGIPNISESSGTLRLVRQADMAFTVNWIAIEP